ncbi:tetratricopeptide repeat protein [Lutibaculum baratangense]|uniref:Uncharacterized protein n=1 Tax=Lutibaculum baratangense AMV1 TaxID=631454 RepID=V4RTI0_9HYPH|nr:tetratricopeptide repeat protein [Lutibaculum baratangense]ESR26385.1 hypothetical protein N177_0885 [Lutibaculum baratangense AMV1]
MARTLYLHIGHGKTGSSYIQASLAKSRRSLEEAGIWYPSPPDADKAASGGISSGNGRMLVGNEIPADRAPADCEAILFSSERLFKHLLDADNRQAVRDWATAAGAGSIEVLLFIRDPIEQLASSYQQAVKRHGTTISLDEFSAKQQMPKDVRDLLAGLRAMSNVRVTVRNYSRVRGSLLPVTAAWLGIDRSLLELPPREQVNRSLTAGELALQRVLNGRVGPSSKILSDPLCELTPDIAADDMRPSMAAQESFWRRLEPFINEVNAQLEAEHHYRADLGPARERPGAPDYLFTDAQIEVIGRSFGDTIEKLRSMLQRQRALTHLAIGDKQANAGHPDRASESFRKALQFDSGNVDATISLAMALLQLNGAVAQPARLAAKAEALAPNHPRLARLKAKLSQARRAGSPARDRKLNAAAAGPNLVEES